jgi:phage portal protein BeeE
MQVSAGAPNAPSQLPLYHKGLSETTRITKSLATLRLRLYGKKQQKKKKKTTHQ